MRITVINRQQIQRVNQNIVRRDLKRVMQELNCQEKSVSLLLVDDPEIRSLNRAYLNRDKATNVLSFAIQEGEFGNVNPEILGDIVISVETAYRHALHSRINFMDELTFLVIHGLLHLLGYDHEQVSLKRAREMKKRERELFFLLRGYYLERS